MAVTINDNVGIHADKPVDSRTMDFSGGISVPFSSVAAAVAAIPSAFRHQYLTIWALAANGDPLEYWWRADTADGSLEPKSKDSVTLNTDGSIVLPALYKVDSIVILPATNLSNLQIGTTNGGNDLEAGSPVTAGVGYTLGWGAYVPTNTSIFFTGLASGTKILTYKKF